MRHMWRNKNRKYECVQENKTKMGEREYLLSRLELWDNGRSVIL